jgi:hypothetical protein
VEGDKGDKRDKGEKFVRSPAKIKLVTGDLFVDGIWALCSELTL